MAMTLHDLLDRLTLGVSGPVLGRPFFADSLDSPRICEMLKETYPAFPAITGKGYYEMRVETPAGMLYPGFRIAQWLGGGHPTIIYHHGSNERPSDLSFNLIFPIHRMKIPANLVAVRAPFHESTTEYIRAMRHLKNFVGMLAASTAVIESLVRYAAGSAEAPVLVTGTSLGGWVANIHHAYFNTAEYYAPLLAGVDIGDTLFNSSYRTLVSDRGIAGRRQVQEALDFEQAFTDAGSANVYPLLALHDQIIDAGVQQGFYRGAQVEVFNRGHITGALSYASMRDHVLGILGMVPGTVNKP